MKKITAFYLVILPLLALPACRHDEYDLSRGIDKEITVFSDQVSVPLGGVGPISLNLLLDKPEVADMIKSYVQIDPDGFLVVTAEQGFYSNVTLLLSMMNPYANQAADIPIDNYSGIIESLAASFPSMGIDLVDQSFTLAAGNPLTEEIGVTGKLTLLSNDEAQESLLSEDFSHVTVAAESTNAPFYQGMIASRTKAPYHCKLENLMLHLPASFLEKDPNSGWSSISLSYQYKTYLALGSDFSLSTAFTLDKLNLPLAQFQVREAKLYAEVSSELPVDLTLDSVTLLASQTNEDGSTAVVPYKDVIVTPGLHVASGSSGEPAVTPLEIVIQAQEGTIPDIAGLQLDVTVGGPTHAGDKRLGVNQTVLFNHIRATVSGGITLQSL